MNELLEELFEPVGGVGLRRMFGGIGVFKDTVMFGLVDDDILYLKADDTTRAIRGRRQQAVDLSGPPPRQRLDILLARSGAAL